MPRFLFTDINKKILTTENPFLKTYFIYYLTVKFLSDGGFSDRNTQKILFVALYDVKPTATRRIGTPPLRTRHAASYPKHREQIIFRREDSNPLSSRRNTICSRNWMWMSARPRNLTALQQRHNLIVVRMREHIEHARGDRLVGGHAR